MPRTFSEQLKYYIKATPLSVRRVAVQAGIPKQTLFNWLNGKEPRLYPGLEADLTRLGQALRMDAPALNQLLLSIQYNPNSIVSNAKKERMNQSQTPTGWFLTGSKPNSYTVGIENEAGNNTTCAYLRSTEPITEQEGFGSLMQHFKSHRFRGKRVCYSARVQTENVEGWVGLWMRVDGLEQVGVMAFDNMQNRSITGTTNWETYDIVLDVPNESEAIAFGILLVGSGTARLSDVKLEPVSLNVPTTSLDCAINLLDEPTNLDFSADHQQETAPES
jgi:transcriptional regulator with XRE-family HTH domain